MREPFPSKNTKADIVFGKITRDVPLKIVSSMPENGVIFSDGIESDYIQFNSGIEPKHSVPIGMFYKRLPTQPHEVVAWMLLF